ncbi:MAG: transcription antitermination factor NusB [Chitinophagales bacterium]|nr:transcription antitermination factor NusB [Chitinophagales bacterium]
MQAVYAYERSEDALPSTFKKQLQKSIDSADALYTYFLYCIREVVNKVDKVSGIKASKFLPTDEDKNYSTKILSNYFIHLLNTDEAYQKSLKATGLSHQLDGNPIVHQLYKQMVATDFYREYIDNESTNIKDEKKIIELIINNILLSNELFEGHLDEVFPSWEEDAAFVLDEIKELIKKSKTELKLHTDKASTKNKIDELLDFSTKLFDKVLYYKEIHVEEIEPYLKNWDIERISVVDMIIIRMGLTEFTDFPSIPVKVTMNEYIEMAKNYSSPKSKDFINGVLDRMMKDMEKEDKIVKIGRGLINK